VLIQNDLNQLLAAERVQSVQDPGCTISVLRARIFKSSDTLHVANQLRRVDLVQP
jgi:hypothetical protein